MYTLLTFGYGGDKSPEDRLFSAMEANDCKFVFDVRDKPFSKSRAEWCAKALNESFQKKGYTYIHEPRLGNKPVKQEGSQAQVRKLPWNKPESWRFGMRVLCGSLLIHGTAGIMCCEGEPFYSSKDANGHNCHRVAIAHEVMLEIYRITGAQVEIVHVRKGGEIRYNTIESAKNYPVYESKLG